MSDSSARSGTAGHCRPGNSDALVPGPPKLLLPAHLLKSIEVRCVAYSPTNWLTCGAGDQWVGRIELVAGLLWWWNPIYWLTCRRLDAESELACDAWASGIAP